MSPAAITALILSYRYLFIFFSAPFLGPIVTLLCGALIRLDTLALIPVCIALMASELSADILWYWLGQRYGAPRGFIRHFGVTEERVEKVKRLYHRYHDSIILISKLTAGFGIAPVIFFTAGLSRVPFRRYMLMNVVGQVIWTPVILAVGYYLGHFYLQVNDAFEKMAFIGTALVVLAALFFIGRHVAMKTLASQKI